MMVCFLASHTVIHPNSLSPFPFTSNLVLTSASTQERRSGKEPDTYGEAFKTSCRASRSDLFKSNSTCIYILRQRFFIYKTTSMPTTVSSKCARSFRSMVRAPLWEVADAYGSAVALQSELLDGVESHESSKKDSMCVQQETMMTIAYDRWSGWVVVRRERLKTENMVVMVMVSGGQRRGWGW